MLRSEIDEGFAVNEACRHLGISSSYARTLFSDPEGIRDRARKARNQGTCETCGGKTTGANGRTRAPRYCAEHSHAAHARWTPENTISTLQALARVLGETPRAQLLLNGHYAAHIILPECPGSLRSLTQQCQIHFGTYNNAVRAAGLPARSQGQRGPAHRYDRSPVETTISPQDLSRTHNCKTENCPNEAASPVGRHAYCQPCQTRRAALRIADQPPTDPAVREALHLEPLPQTHTPRAVAPLTPRSNPLTTHEARCKELVTTARALDRAERQLRTAKARTEECRRAHREALAALQGT